MQVVTRDWLRSEASYNVMEVVCHICRVGEQKCCHEIDFLIFALHYGHCHYRHLVFIAVLFIYIDCGVYWANSLCWVDSFPSEIFSGTRVKIM